MISETILCVSIFSDFSPLQTNWVYVQQLKSGQRMQYVHYYCTFTSQRIARTNQGRAMVQRFSGGRGRREASAAREAAMVPCVDGDRRGGGGAMGGGDARR
jgi:hypothetical protein